MILDSVTLCPAYGRDYRSARQAREDFDQGKDFEVYTPWSSGQKSSKAELKALGVKRANIRYNKRTQVCVVSL